MQLHSQRRTEATEVHPKETENIYQVLDEARQKKGMSKLILKDIQTPKKLRKKSTLPEEMKRILIKSLMLL
ncbi:hypothetical protein [Prochlorococcus marinus]|uniref:hypothetical protein n=1 Tax=Prochlorococcus marinus TaxID=1219 RepID=UPI0007B394AB|nr:hypothetical protein [Prochlorococcus marinus]KZR73740.1 hypothetical protein PMIT1320_02336 [Prochlorococcus marinus str. MIT 1320]